MKSLKLWGLSFFCFLVGSCGMKNAKIGPDGQVDKEVEEYNYIIGTQTVGAKYKFTDETNLVETAREIRSMGSNLLKMSMSPRYWWENYDIPKNDSICSLRDLAQEESMRRVLGMDFKYYQIWAYEFSQYIPEPPGEKIDVNQIQFVNDLSQENMDKSYREIYDLAAYLLETYSGSGKVFFLGNWEGDWHLRWDYNKQNEINPLTIVGMTKWVNVRQKAIDDAKRDTPHSDVDLYHYLELNHSDKAVAGEPCVTNSMLPQVDVDYVSFSSYTATELPETEQEMDSILTAHLNYIESKIKPKEGIQGKRLFVGEYGWGKISAEESDRRAKWVIKSALRWGSPFILYWEMYNNEIETDGSNRGFWLINDKKEKLPLYHTHQAFYEEGKDFVRAFKQQNGRLPQQSEFIDAALTFDALK